MKTTLNMSSKIWTTFMPKRNHQGIHSSYLHRCLAFHVTGSKRVDCRSQHTSVQRSHLWTCSTALVLPVVSEGILRQCKNQPTRTAKYSTNSDDSSKKPPRRHVTLFSLTKGPNYVYPNLFKSLQNVLYTFLVRKIDPEFTQKGFLEGAQQAVHTVSEYISEGQFDKLEGLVSKEIVDEVKRNYHRLSDNQREVIAVNPRDIVMKFIYDIKFKHNTSTGERFVEVMTVFHGNRSFAEFLLHHVDDKPTSSKERLNRVMRYVNKNFYVCNYRFKREFTKGKEDEDWTINRLNHFLPQE